MPTTLMQRFAHDCGIAALAHFAELSYEDTYVAASKVDRQRRGKQGLCNYEIVAIAKVLGIGLVATRRFDLSTDEGVLRIQWKKKRDKKEAPGGHFVSVKHGLITDPNDGISRPWEEYCTLFSANPATLLKG